jgi:hypothetical protein
MRIRNTIFAALLLAQTSMGTPVESFNLKRLIRDSDVIVSGTLTVEKVEPAEIEIQGRKYPANFCTGRIAIESAAKSSTLDEGSLELHWIVPNSPGGSMGYSSPRAEDKQVFFIKRESQQIVWTSHTYPSVPASSAPIVFRRDANTKLSPEEIERQIVKVMTAFAEETTHPDYERAGSLLRASHSDLPVVHESALRLVNDSSASVREMAVTVLARFKDKRALFLAKEMIAEAANQPEKGAATNVLLALSQEFKEESLPAFELALAGNNAQMRRDAAFAARYTESSRIIPSLLKLVSSPDPETAWNAMHSLGELTQHMDWRPLSQDPAEFQRCIGLWQRYAREQRITLK